MDRIDTKKTFLQVYDSRSFSQAARVLGISVAKVSKHIAELEEQLSVRLFDRTTRIVIPTKAANEYAPKLLVILEALEQLEESVAQENESIKGTLNVSIPMDYGKRIIAPLLAKFLLDYPDIKLQVEYSDQVRDLYEGHFDLAIRASALIDSGLHAVKIDEMGLLAGASPAYILSHGRPMVPTDLIAHHMLGYSLSAKKWQFQDKDGGEVSVKLDSRLISNNGEAVVLSALCDVGIAYQLDFMMKPYFKSGQLVPVLENYCHRKIGVFAVFLARDFLPLRTRKLIDYLRANLGYDNTAKTSIV